MAIEFDCCECGRHIVQIAPEVRPDPLLCAVCLNMPGWFNHPEVRAAIDPDHDGIDRSTVGASNE